MVQRSPVGVLAVVGADGRDVVLSTRNRLQQSAAMTEAIARKREAAYAVQNYLLSSTASEMGLEPEPELESAADSQPRAQASSGPTGDVRPRQPRILSARLSPARVHKRCVVSLLIVPMPVVVLLPPPLACSHRVAQSSCRPCGPSALPA